VAALAAARLIRGLHHRWRDYTPVTPDRGISDDVGHRTVDGFANRSYLAITESHG
jgi:hypothetical protein